MWLTRPGLIDGVSAVILGLLSGRVSKLALQGKHMGPFFFSTPWVVQKEVFESQGIFLSPGDPRLMGSFTEK